MMKLSFNSPSYISMLSSSGYSTVMDSTISITQLPVEILEEILLNLSQRDLLLCQSVCRQWHSLITTSPALLRKLFFVPGTLANGKAQVNRLLQELFPPFFPNKQTVSSRWNALLAPLGVPWIKSLPWYKSEVRRAAVLRQDASWRRMFLSHPVPRLGDIVALETDSNNNVKTFVGDIADEDGEMCKSGVQMGLLFDIAVHMVDSVLWGGDFSVHWWMVNQGTVIEGKDPVLVIGLYAQRTTIVWNRANITARRSGLHVARLTPGFISFRRVGDIPRRRRFSFTS
ncbi:hypothetical protein CNMCM5793_006059 [Aspergillus hiratsukae]|uniref:F-box domain-containing protein n=1 Tax=Aspergillus hiratsukae TaxID=1194566 RepID=A0A8H6P3Y1_9EURO|nr:hypothetical protein CNMCM5793_006059 [Aspergillus hiratsukae]